MLEELSGRTAVVTGAASGIGLGLTRRCLDHGMAVAMLDVEAGALRAAADDLEQSTRIATFTVDVSDAAQVDEAAEAVRDRFGAVHLLCNNAGVTVTGALWTMTDADWRWATGVNLFGVANGVRAFVPAMLEGGEPGHVVNTASMSGLVFTPNAGVYSATKAAVVALSEVLYHELRDAESQIGVSVLCPALVNTNIMRSLRNRPDDLAATGEAPIPESAHAYFATGEDTGRVADRVLTAVARDDFYVLTNEASRVSIAARSEAVARLGAPVRPLPGSTAPDPEDA
jgi:NAD(P)-dependent dehydrogenase (short-subunit alcohol dehydrogenase family)